jgi:SAM-dependent MidA family methyltransferase
LKIEDLVRERGPMTVAAFMNLALYDARLGYYARAVQRSGRAGDFFTSVDVGPLFGDLLEHQIAEMAAILSKITAEDAKDAEESILGSASSASSAVNAFDIVEAGAGNGRLSADLLRAARERHPALYDQLRLHLVEASAEARRAHAATLEGLVSFADGSRHTSSASLPESFEGVLLANELLDALPVHQVVMREDGLREVYVVNRQLADAGGRSASREGGLTTVEGPPSTPELAAYLARLDVVLEPGWRTEINLRAVEWVRDAGRRLRRGFLMLIDYGHEARDLYSAAHAGGTLTSFSRHTMTGPETATNTPAWLERPGGQDLTSHVDFTSVRAAAEGEGLVTLGFLDQTYFLLGILLARDAAGSQPADLRESLALKTLLMPGGLGSTHKVLILGKGVGRPPLLGCSFRQRVT